MKRRSFNEKFLMALASLGAVGCTALGASDETPNMKSSESTVGCNDLPNIRPEVEAIRARFEDQLWTMATLGASEVDSNLQFASAEDCKMRYRCKVDKYERRWYHEMLKRLDREFIVGKDPTNVNETHYRKYYINFYRCCYRAGMVAARLTKTKRLSVISTDDFEWAMEQVQATFFRLGSLKAKDDQDLYQNFLYAC